ncbi:MAG: hypothetical protein IJZ80_10115 [Clostridia bacterium]|nr:hypothetical protein [Clostridia bacterium]
MKTAVKRISKITLSLILILALSFSVIYRLIVDTSGNERYFSGAAEEYCQGLIEAGFPSDYAIALTELHMLHPEWTFIPLDITGQKSTYTWSYVIEQETVNPETNLIPASNTYSAYHHETNKEKYDSGYYQASVAAVEYFMDPRNFLNETDIFQFFDLASGTDASIQAIEAVLIGTFMQNAVLENGLSYAAFFQKLGIELGVNPVYLAVKARQEQGVAGSSPIISGTCGTKLWEFYRDQKQYSDTGSQIVPPTSGYSEESLKALDGYYNFYNIKASGTGLFKIYYNAMQRAKTGTEEMKNIWGGNASWNTKWKSIYGGAHVLKENYVDRYQSTVYLQKFNVDSRSDRNFYGQYMQAISGGLNEARSLFQSFASIDSLDAAYTFLIPIYEGMPSEPAPDPAKGSCTLLAQSPTRYSYRTNLTSPSRYSSTSTPIYTEIELYENASMNVSGIMSHSYGIQELQYAWDFGQWQTASNRNQIDFSVSADFSADSTHILIVRGKADYDHTVSTKKHNAYFLCAIIYVKVIEPPQVSLTYKVGNTVETHTLSAGTTVTLPQSDSDRFAGWIGSDGTFFPPGTNLSIITDMTYSALFLDLHMLEGAALSTTEEQPHLRFSAALDERSYLILSSLPADFCTIIGSIHCTESQQTLQTNVRQIKTVEINSGNMVKLDFDTEPLSKNEYQTIYSATLSITLRYTNGEQKTISATPADTERSAKQVATAALADPEFLYSAETVEFLKTIANAT